MPFSLEPRYVPVPLSRQERKERDAMLRGLVAFNELARRLGSPKRFVMIGHPQLDLELVAQRQRQRDLARLKRQVMRERFKMLRKRQAGQTAERQPNQVDRSEAARKAWATRRAKAQKGRKNHG